MEVDQRDIKYQVQCGLEYLSQLIAALQRQNKQGQPASRLSGWLRSIEAATSSLEMAQYDSSPCRNPRQICSNTKITEPYQNTTFRNVGTGSDNINIDIMTKSGRLRLQGNHDGWEQSKTGDNLCAPTRFSEGSLEHTLSTDRRKESTTAAIRLSSLSESLEGMHQRRIDHPPAAKHEPKVDPTDLLHQLALERSRRQGMTRCPLKDSVGEGPNFSPMTSANHNPGTWVSPRPGVVLGYLSEDELRMLMKEWMKS